MHRKTDRYGVARCAGRGFGYTGSRQVRGRRHRVEYDRGRADGAREERSNAGLRGEIARLRRKVGHRVAVAGHRPIPAGQIHRQRAVKRGGTRHHEMPEGPARRGATNIEFKGRGGTFREIARNIDRPACREGQQAVVRQVAGQGQDRAARNRERTVVRRQAAKVADLRPRAAQEHGGRIGRDRRIKVDRGAVGHVPGSAGQRGAGDLGDPAAQVEGA